jgi:hypothetical protein
VDKLTANRALVNNDAVTHKLDNKVTRAVQNKMLTALKKLSDDGLIFEKNGVWQ